MDSKGWPPFSDIGNNMTAYQPNIPTGTVKLNQDYINIRNNFGQLETTYSTDHVPLSEPTQNGFHKAVHMVQQVAPAAVAGVGSLYCTTTNDLYDTDQVLYYQTGLDKIIQMSRNFVPLAAQNGYTFLPGGLVLQWGFETRVPSSDQSGTVTLPIPFKNNFFNVMVSISNSANTTANGTASARITALNLTTFSVSTKYLGGPNFNGFYWMAIGN
jgi:hypothetical protein